MKDVSFFFFEIYFFSVAAATGKGVEAARDRARGELEAEEGIGTSGGTFSIFFNPSTADSAPRAASMLTST
jgi:hypothetical protein